MVTTASRARSLAGMARLLVRHRGLVGTRQEADLTPDAELEEAGRTLAADLEAMGPTFVKLGQLLSTRPDLLPDPYLDALSRLHDKVDPFPADQARAIFQEEVGAPASTTFSEFDDRPLASASIGQVHTARMRGGRRVVVKIQRPGVEARIQADVDALSSLAEAVDSHTDAGRHFGFAEMFSQFRRSLLDELDYRVEAANLVRMHRMLEDLGVVVPRPVEDFSSRRVLTMQRVEGRSVGDLGPLARTEIDGPDLADQLIRAYLEQVFAHGFFHADPHPGNVMVTDDGGLAIIDLGMVGRLAEPARGQLAKLVLAMDADRASEVSDVLVEMGRPLDDFDEALLRRSVAEVVGRSVLQRPETRAGRVVMDLTQASAEAGLRPPPDLVMLGRTLLNLERVTYLLDPDFEPDQAVSRHAAEIVRSQFGAGPRSAIAALVEARDFVEHLPGRVNRVMDALARGQFAVKVHAFDEAEMLSGLQKLANRLAMGLVISALLLGAALLMRVPSSSRLLGYPSVAIVCFIVAAVLGVGLVVSIILADRHVRRRARRSRRN
jgi:ubiquinone biosynthesis protein